MIYPEKIKILAKKNQPRPEEARYWVDLTADPYGGIWKVWNGLTWIRVFSSSGSGGGIEEAPSDGNLYGRKNQVWQEIDIPDVSIYATKTELEQKADKDSVPDLSDYLTANDIAKYYQPKGNYLTEIPEGYLTITEADGRYALKDESGGEVDIDLSDYLTIANAESTYATKTEVQTVRESVQAEVDTKQDTLISGTNIKTINGSSLLGSGNITLETPEGGLSDAASNGKLYGRKDGTWSEIVIPDTSELATKSELSSKLDTETYNVDKATFALKTEIPDTSTFITTETADGKYQPKGTYLTEVPDEYVTDVELTEQLALKADASELSNYLTTASATSTYATKTDLDSKLDTSTYTSDKSTFATTTQLSSKQDTLVSGTNIKTVNGQTILGEGNVQIETPEGGIADAPNDDNTYARKNGAWTTITIPDTSDLATKQEVQAKQDTLISGTNIKTINGASLLGSGNITIETPEGGISDAPQDGKTYGRKDAQWSEITIPDTSALATKTEIADMATQTWVGEQGYLTEHQDISNLATKEELASKANTSDLSNYLTTANASTTYETISGAQNKYQPVGEYALKSEIPSLSGYATESYVNTQVSNLVNSAPEALNTLDELAAALNDDSNFATTVTNQIAAKLDVTTYTNDKETFALKTELSSKADSSALANYVTTATAESTYAKKSEIPQQSLLPYDFFGTIDNYSTNNSITIDADSKYLSVYNVQSDKSLLDINFTNGLYKGVEYLVIVISNNYTLNVRPQGYGGQKVQVIGDTKQFSMQANQILEISAIRTDSAVICRVSSSSGYIDSVYDGIFG